MVGYGLTRRRRRAHQAKQQIASAREKRLTDAFGEDGKIIAAALSREKPSVFESSRPINQAPPRKLNESDRKSVSNDELMKRLSVPPPPSINERVGKASQSLAEMSGPRLLFKIFSLVFVAHIVMSTYLHFTREDHLDDQAYD